MKKILSNITELKKKILQIHHTESLDDVKELEYYDYEIVDLIYKYCVSKNYNIEGFPEKYLSLIEVEDEDFNDFLSFNVKHYYILKNSLLHKDVFLLVKAHYNDLETKDYTNEDCKKDVLVSIKILTEENINLIFNRSDYSTTFLNTQKPKIP